MSQSNNRESGTGYLVVIAVLIIIIMGLLHNQSDHSSTNYTDEEIQDFLIDDALQSGYY